MWEVANDKEQGKRIHQKPYSLAMVSLSYLCGKTQKQKWNDCLWEVANDKEQGKRIHQKPYNFAMVNVIPLYGKTKTKMD